MKADRTTPRNIDEHIAGFPRDVQATLEKLRVTIRRAAPDAQEAIKYHMPTFVQNGKLVFFAAYKRHERPATCIRTAWRASCITDAA
jgi:uncharacterized protein YdhG (YjbR/CyaY superfamily)